jgi:hypothetical protein
VTAEQIREVQLTVIKRETEDGPLEYAVDLNLRKFEMLREIAAQLAEQNQGLAEERRAIMADGDVHLGCLVRKPDGAHVISTDNGVLRLEPDEAKRIVGMIAPLINSSRPS